MQCAHCYSHTTADLTNMLNLSTMDPVLQRPTYKCTQHFASMNITYFCGHIFRASDGNSGVCTDVQ